MKTFRKTLFAVALTAGIFTSFPALAENCVKPNLGGLTHRQKVENYPEMVDCAYRNVLAAKNADGNWVYLDNKTGKVLFTFPNGKQPAGLVNIDDSNGWDSRVSYHNGIDAFLDYGLIKTDTMQSNFHRDRQLSVIDKQGHVILNQDRTYDLYIFGKNNTIIKFNYKNHKPIVIFHDLAGEYLSEFKMPSDNLSSYVSEKHGWIEEVGNAPMGLEIYNFGKMVENSLISVMSKEPVGDYHLKGYVNLSGNVVIPIEHTTLGNFSEGLVRASDPKNGNFIGYLNKTGKVVIPYEYNNLRRDDDSVRRRRNNGVIDLDFTNGAAQVCQETCFYINKQGKKVADPRDKKKATSKKQSNKKQSSGKSAATGAVAGGVVGGIKGGIIGGVIGAIVGD